MNYIKKYELPDSSITQDTEIATLYPWQTLVINRGKSSNFDIDRYSEVYNSINDYKPIMINSSGIGWDSSDGTYRMTKQIRVANGDGTYNTYIVPIYAAENVKPINHQIVTSEPVIQTTTNTESVNAPN